jgi:hypothetical protein
MPFHCDQFNKQKIEKTKKERHYKSWNSNTKGDSMSSRLLNARVLIIVHWNYQFGVRKQGNVSTMQLI